jgi:hypothetical protein
MDPTASVASDANEAAPAVPSERALAPMLAAEEMATAASLVATARAEVAYE